MLLLLVTVVATTIAVSVNQSCGSPRAGGERVVENVPSGSVQTDSSSTSIRSVRRHGGGSRMIPPDTAGFFFGKRANFGRHPNANNLLFGKRSTDEGSDADDRGAAPTEEVDKFKFGVCMALQSTCIPIWTATEYSNEDNGF